MLTAEPIPIELFLNHKLMKSSLQSMLDEWRLEPDLVHSVLVRHFRDMGIFSVSHGQDAAITGSILFFLRNAPEIITYRQRAKADELNRRHTRHAD